MSDNDLDPQSSEAMTFYTQRYAFAEPLFLTPGGKLALGNKEKRICRFCNRTTPEVTFRLEAHAIPESLGNKCLISYYECDDCNQAFGRGIENDLGNWSKASRTFARIVGKNGVPNMKKGGKEPGWRIEYGPNGFEITQYESDPVFFVDDEKKQITFQLKRDPYTPVAVLKAFVKIGLTILPDDELPNFIETLAWVRDPDHSKSFLEKFTIVRTFQPGPMRNDLITVWLLRRKPSITDVPYAFMVLAYGNEIFQVPLPSLKQDAMLSRESFTIPAFPTPGSLDPQKYSRGKPRSLDLSSREVVRGEIVPYMMSYESRTIPQ